MLNRITIMGRMTAKPEKRYTQSQKPVTTFTLAVDRDFKGPDNRRETDFIPCVSWNGTADYVAKYFDKGSMAAVSGRLQIREWTDKDGGKRRTAEVLADNVYFGESKRPEDDFPKSYEPARDPVDAFAELEDDDEDSPF